MWTSQGSLNVTTTSLAFFQQFSSSVAVGTYASTTTTYTTLTTGVKTFADGFVALNAKYTPSDGSLSEQYDKSTGVPTSATDLTWSYASALTVFAARGGFVPASWGASGLTLPSTCSSGGGGGTTVAVTFNVYATTVYGGEFLQMCVPCRAGADVFDRKHLLDGKCITVSQLGSYKRIVVVLGWIPYLEQ